jgi:hypothetical protein
VTKVVNGSLQFSRPSRKKKQVIAKQAKTPKKMTDLLENLNKQKEKQKEKPLLQLDKNGFLSPYANSAKGLSAAKMLIDLAEKKKSSQQKQKINRKVTHKTAQSTNARPKRKTPEINDIESDGHKGKKKRKVVSKKANIKKRNISAPALVKKHIQQNDFSERIIAQQLTSQNLSISRAFLPNESDVGIAKPNARDIFKWLENCYRSDNLSYEKQEDILDIYGKVLEKMIDLGCVENELRDLHLRLAHATAYGAAAGLQKITALLTQYWMLYIDRT